MRILILDYSTDRSEAVLFQQWLPEGSRVELLYIDTEQSFPGDLINRDFTHVIHSGSLLSITETSPFTQKAVSYIRRVRDKGVAQMGVCYGHQLLNRALVGEHAVRQSPNGFEAGWRSVSFTNESIQVPGVSVKEIVWQHHFDEVVELPAGSVIFASNQHSRIQAFINPDQLLLGTQFHPEFDRDQGNEFFQKDRKRLEKFHFNVDEIIRQGPSIETGKIFFNYFLNHFNITQ